MMAGRTPIGAMAKRMLSNIVKGDLRNCIVACSPNKVISGPRLDTKLTGKIAGVGVAKAIAVAMMTHILAVVCTRMG